MTFVKLIEETLKKANIPLSVEEIWEKAKEYGFADEVKSRGKTPERTIGAKLYVDIKNGNSIFYQVSKRPAKFFLTTLKFNNDENKNLIISESKKKFKERDLHPLLSSFVYSDSHFKCYTKTIFHEKSSRGSRGKNEWLHPDIVGVYFPYKDYDPTTISFQDAFRGSNLKVFSFEIKIKVDFSNFREYYFQAVSNSSWANEGYLVATDFEDRAELIEELLRLNNAFGIGIIKLNTDNIEQSEILIPSKKNETIDWETVDRLIEANDDFRHFIISINDVVKSDSKIVHGEVFDKIKSEQDIIKYIKEKQIE